MRTFSYNAELIGNSAVQALLLKAKSRDYTDCWMLWERFPTDLVGSGDIGEYNNWVLVSKDHTGRSGSSTLCCPGTIAKDRTTPIYLGDQESSTRRTIINAVDGFAVDMSDYDGNTLEIPSEGIDDCVDIETQDINIILFVRGHSVGILVKRWDIGQSIYKVEDGIEMCLSQSAASIVSSNHISMGAGCLPLRSTRFDDVNKAIDVYNRWVKFFSKLE